MGRGLTVASASETDTELLIERLSDGPVAVRRLLPPMLRAALWLLALAVVAAGAVGLFADWRTWTERVRLDSLAVEMMASLSTGVLAVIAAFALSLPDRSARWALLPLPTLALWLAASGVECWQHRAESGSPADSSSCLLFIISWGLPLGAALLLVLRRARPIHSGRTALTAGLGAAGLATFLLQFFHPFDVTLLDLGVHLVAGATVVAACAMARLLR